MGGVNSPRRLIRPCPFFTDRAKGPFLWDVEGNRYVDYCLGYGPLILGHAHERIVDVIKTQSERGFLYGTPHRIEVDFARELTSSVPNVEMIRCVNSGTEATMAALRLARGITGQDKIAMFNGSYHGTHDSVIIKGCDGRPTPYSKGVPLGTASNTLLATFNDIRSVEQCLSGEDVAAVIIEPIMCDRGCILPKKNFLKDVRRACSNAGTLLIFDEVITGFRMCMGGAQEYYGVKADLVTYGKVIGGGMPIGAIGGTRDLMENFAPLGDVYNAGTFNGNPMAMAAGLETLRVLREENVHRRLKRTTGSLMRGLKDTMPENSAINGVPGMMQFYFGVNDVDSPTDVEDCDQGKFMELQGGLTKNGVFLPPANTEANFVSAAHDDEVIETTIEIFADTLKNMKNIR